ncbi:hypothetical protein ACFQ1O_11805 [Pseudofulvibacter geojedonensis]|uniref:PsbP C-terminal domain-containing protein n=2 Tax=Pseudofulvibacter geojedonensis TaxID=1123758 RepID=A0ABW3I496_9FLAO
MKIVKLSGIFILIMSLTACYQNKSNDSQTSVLDGWKSIVDNNYSINYPSNWELDESGQMGTRFILFSPLSSDQDQFRENINLLIQDLSGHNLDLEKYVEISIDQINRMITDGNILKNKRKLNKELNYHQLIYTGKQGEYKLKFEQYLWVIKNKAYVLTLTCEDEQFSNYQKIGEEIMNSFKLKNTAQNTQ